MRRAICAAATAVVICAANAAAQGAPPAGRLEIGGGVSWMGKAGLGSIDANESTAGGGTSRLFTTSTELRPATGFEAHVGVRLTRTLEAVAAGTFIKPTLSTEIANDTESSGTVTATETIKQFAFSGGVLWYLPKHGERIFPFATGTIGYLRQLHEGDILAATGRIYTLGGGVKLFVPRSQTGRRKGFGVRGEAAVVVRTGGVTFDNGTIYSPLLQATAFLRF